MSPMSSTPKDPPRAPASTSAGGIAPNYFDRLAAQAVQPPLAPKLEPRIASRFEPGAAGDLHEQAALREVEAWVEVDAGSPSPSSAEVMQAPERPARGAAPARARPAPRAPMPAASQPPALGDLASLVHEPRGTAAAVDLQSPGAPQGEPQPQVPLLASRPADRHEAPALGPATRDAHMPESASAQAAGTRPEAASAPTLGPIERLDAAPARWPAEHAAVAQAQTLAASERSTGLREARAAERQAAAAPAPIEIHIDRIEVRGFTPAAAPVAQHAVAAPARTPTGLDELLRRRRGEPA